MRRFVHKPAFMKRQPEAKKVTTNGCNNADVINNNNNLSEKTQSEVNANLKADSNDDEDDEDDEYYAVQQNHVIRSQNAMNRTMTPSMPRGNAIFGRNSVSRSRR